MLKDHDNVIALMCITLGSLLMFIVIIAVAVIIWINLAEANDKRECGKSGRVVLTTTNGWTCAVTPGRAP